MSQAMFRLRLNRWLLLITLIAGPLPWLAGCGESDKGPITAQDSQYQLGNDRSDDPPREPADGAVSDRTAAPATDVATSPPSGSQIRLSDLPESPAGVAPQSSGETVGTKPPTTSPPASQDQPPSPPAFDPANPDVDNLDPNNLPDSERDVLALIEVLQVRQPQGRTQQEQLEDYLRIQFARIKAAEKLWDLATSKESRISAVQTKMDALRVMARYEVPNADKQLNTYCRSLQENEDPDVAHHGRLMLFGLALDDMALAWQAKMRGDVAPVKPIDTQAVLGELKSLAAEAGAFPGTFEVLSQAADAFLRFGYREAAIEAYRAIGESYQGNADKVVAADALVMLERVRILEAGMDTRLQAAASGEAGSEAPMLETIDALLAADGAGTGTLLEMGQAGAIMELTDQYDLARKIYEKIGVAFKDNSDAELAGQAAEMVSNGLKHVDLIGKPLEMTGVRLDGTPFDWSAYKGKVVLVSFWTLSEQCMFEINNIYPLYRQYRDKGFDVVAVNLDADTKTVQRFMDIQPLPWAVVISADPEKQGTENPLAIRCGVDLLPFAVLVGRDGNVVALHVRQQRLQEKLRELLGPPPGALPGNLPGGPAPAQPPATTPGPPANQPPAGDQSRDMPEGPEVFFVSFGEPAAEDASENPADEAAAEIEQINPYLPREGLSPDDLVDFLFTMQDKPASIQQRPGFGAALVEAADRILAAETTDKNRRIAAETKFGVLHGKACLGDEKADAELVKFVEQMKDSQDEKIAQHVRFFQLERQAIDVDKLPLEKVPELLAELKKYLVEQKLDDRHLRMASGTVHAINRLEDADKREEYFQEFGGIFTKSESKDLARYGKKLAKKPGVEMPDLLGKPLALAGVTALGTEFDWDSYRGKVVLVDFWATWCGPCRAAMPQVKELYEQLREQGFDIVGVNLDKDQEQLAKYLDENEIAWTNLVGDEATEIAKKYGVTAIPTMILVDREGTVVAAGNKLDTLKPALDRLVKKTDG